MRSDRRLARRETYTPRRAAPSRCHRAPRRRAGLHGSAGSQRGSLASSSQSLANLTPTRESHGFARKTPSEGVAHVSAPSRRFSFSAICWLLRMSAFRYRDRGMNPPTVARGVTSLVFDAVDQTSRIVEGL